MPSPTSSTASLHDAGTLHTWRTRSTSSCSPGHLAEVLIELRFTLVRAGEDDLPLLACCLHLFVRLHELRCEASARWAPVRREVDADGVQLLERLARCRVTLVVDH